jgi:hypothetical protein
MKGPEGDVSPNAIPGRENEVIKAYCTHDYSWIKLELSHQWNDLSTIK